MSQGSDMQNVLRSFIMFDLKIYFNLKNENQATQIHCLCHFKTLKFSKHQYQVNFFYGCQNEAVSGKLKSIMVFQGELLQKCYHFLV